jgi:hypothetical protein
MVALSAIMALHAAFNNLYGIGNNLLHYLAMPRIFHNGFNFSKRGPRSLLTTTKPFALPRWTALPSRT